MRQVAILAGLFLAATPSSAQDKTGKGYGAFSWRLGLLTPKSR
mgnify:CR=1 FL=1